MSADEILFDFAWGWYYYHFYDLLYWRLNPTPGYYIIFCPRQRLVRAWEKRLRSVYGFVISSAFKTGYKPMDVKLIVAAGKNVGQEVPVKGPRFFIGRTEDCHLRPRSDLISRHHCVILAEEGFLAVRDFGSKNGTYINDQRVTGETELKNGDHLRIGAMEFELHVAGEPAAKPPEPAEKKAALAGKKPKVHNVQEAASRTVQTAESAQDDDDVSSWLDEESSAMNDTATIDPTQTVEAPKADKSVKPAAEPVEEPPPEDEEEEPQKDRVDPFHVTGASKKQGTPSSKNAAANMLKNFFRR